MGGNTAPMRLYCTAARNVVPLSLNSDVSMYVCGITPYEATHLGHAATFVTYDLIVRRLESLGHTVTLVRNYTDVDDSILPKAAELGEHYLSLAAREIERFGADLTALEMRPAAAEPRATQSIAAIVELIERLSDAGHTYAAQGVTYFDVATFDGFGELSGYTAPQMLELAAERGGTPDNPHQRNPLDFVLWQPSASGEPAWPSPFGLGRPGWHIECSAMVAAALGDTVDIHGGGGDLIFPHHECERAQSESLSGVPLARYWVHAALVAFCGEKMSKSLGNLVYVSDLRAAQPAAAIRLALLRHHYRTPWEWQPQLLTEAADDLAALREATRAAPPVGPPAEGADNSLLAEVAACLDDDLDTPNAHKLITDAARQLASRTDTAAEGRGDLFAAAQLCGVSAGGSAVG